MCDYPKVPSNRGLVGCGRGGVDGGGGGEVLLSAPLMSAVSLAHVVASVDLRWLVKTTYDFWVLLTIGDHHWTLATTVDHRWLLLTIVDYCWPSLTSLILCWNRPTIKSIGKMNAGKREREEGEWGMDGRREYTGMLSCCRTKQEREGDGPGNVWSLRIWWEDGWGREGGREEEGEVGGRRVDWTCQVDISEWWNRANDRLVISQKEEGNEGGGVNRLVERRPQKEVSVREEGRWCIIWLEQVSKASVWKWAGGGDQLVCWSKGPQGEVEEGGNRWEHDCSEVAMRRHRSWWCGVDGGLIFHYAQMYSTIYELLVKELTEQESRWERIDRQWWENGWCKRGVEILILMMEIDIVW